MRTSQRRLRIRRRVGAAIGAGALGFVIASPPASLAEPVENPCQLAVTFLCHFVPIAPEWEGDIDLTQNMPAADPSVPLPEERTPADYCINGCI
ncbi:MULTISPECIES: fibronectin-binding protein [Mycolicibacterium]|uniref:fibronectin-binding protein n=1 Tax=Mycolicibacterium TaxID=1866885 RepID=UPI001F1D881B|nr:MULTISPECIES: fibronectin-binding protein [Mycolicibacterium]MDW5610716.1 fibronectin-binding protein [Mycolicibacterium sp. D5.8-2]WND58646.1 fibronectin-binding protein [Mycolicibacterium vanbaalenii]